MWTIDLQDRLMKLTDDLDNADMHRIVIRGVSHKRPRPSNSRFGGPKSLPLKKRAIQQSLFDKLKGVFKDGEHEFNWLGMTWMQKFNEGKMPSLEQISKGLVDEALVQLKQVSGDVKD